MWNRVNAGAEAKPFHDTVKAHILLHPTARRGRILVRALLCVRNYRSQVVGRPEQAPRDNTWYTESYADNGVLFPFQ